MKICSDCHKVSKEQGNYCTSCGGNLKVKKLGFRINIFISIGLVLIISCVVLFTFRKTNIETVKDSVVLLKVYDKQDNLISTGSGFCTYKSNYIVTNYHVIEGGYKITVETDDNQIHNVTSILIFEKDMDLAILEANVRLNPIKIANSNKLRAGETVSTIGSPKGMLNTVSEGIISNADNDDYIRFTAPISPGSSGGVLLNDRNEVIGITTATYNSIDAQNINFARSTEYLKELYRAYENDDYIFITENLLSEYVVEDTKLEDETLSNAFIKENKKYRPFILGDSFEIFYQATNGKEIFDDIINQWSAGIVDVYSSMSKTEKEKVYLYFAELSNSYNEEWTVSNIKSWNGIEWVLNLTDIYNYELAITLVATENKNSNKCFNIINDMHLDFEEKILILLKLCGYDWSKINSEDKEELFNYIGDNIEFEAAMIILEELGYRIEQTSDDEYWGYW